MADKVVTIEEALALMRHAEEKEFWGKIEFNYQSGMISFVRRTETFTGNTVKLAGKA